MTESHYPIRLTQYSSGGGCGCKISPKILDTILAQGKPVGTSDPRLLVGNEDRDDAAAYLLEDGETVMLATTDFFLPIADDPFEFGRIASANAISDVYAMGGRPVLALAVLGWPLDLLAPEVAGDVVAGARALCAEAGVSLAGGHSIDSSEPIFGLAVNGIVSRENLKANAGAKPGDLLFLTKGLGVGILSSALKKGAVRPGDEGRAVASMTRLNRLGTELATLPGVHAMTDVTGFGLLGHLLEMCRASGVRTRVSFPKVPVLTDLVPYLEADILPGGSRRNWESYGHDVSVPDETVRDILVDPQTSGGLLVAVDPNAASEIADLLRRDGLDEFVEPIGQLLPEVGEGPRVVVER